MNQTQIKKRKFQNNNRFLNGYGRKKTMSRFSANRRGINGARIHPELFVKKAISPEENNYMAERTIHQMPLHDRLKTILHQKGFIYPTEIQDKTLEKLIEGNDLLGIAQTGTGKTGAYLIPLIHNMINNRNSMKVLVIVPTRELAVQVEHEFATMTRGLGFLSSCFIGGTSINNDLHRLRRENHLVAGP